MTVAQGILLALFTQINQLVLVIPIWFVFELVENIMNIYASDKLNSSLFTDISKRLSKFRVMIAVGGVLGHLTVSHIWDQLGMSMSFYFSSAVLILVAIFTLFKNKQAF